jgi:hypothetical protein
MTGTSGRSAFAFSKSSRPLIPGMLMSDKIRINDAPAGVAEQPRQGGMGVAHGSIQAAASWPKLNGLINVLDGAGTHPGLSLIVARAFAASFRSSRISARGATAAIELSSCDERQTITDNSGLGWPTAY